MCFIVGARVGGECTCVCVHKCVEVVCLSVSCCFLNLLLFLCLLTILSFFLSLFVFLSQPFCLPFSPLLLRGHSSRAVVSC